MDKQEIEQLIKERVSEAKLEVSEQRLQTITWVAGGFLALFGVIVPLWFTSRSSDQVDSAIGEMKRDFSELSQASRNDSKTSSENLNKSVESLRAEFKSYIDDQSRQAQATNEKVDRAVRDMQSQFKELAGIQLRRPVLECLLAGRTLEASVVNLSPNDASVSQLELRNSGDAPARNIRIRIYVAIDEEFELSSDNIQWQQLGFSDEPTYKRVYETYQPFVLLDGKESRPIGIGLSGGPFPQKSVPALLKIYYEQPEPKKYSFTINIVAQK